MENEFQNMEDKFKNNKKIIFRGLDMKSLKIDLDLENLEELNLEYLPYIKYIVISSKLENLRLLNVNNCNPCVIALISELNSLEDINILGNDLEFNTETKEKVKLALDKEKVIEIQDDSDNKTTNLVLNKCKNLKNLICKDNDISSMIYSLETPHLKRMEWINNKTETIKFGTDLNELETLLIQKNNITSFEHSCDMIKLQTFSLTDSNIEKLEFNRNLSSLRTLILRNNNLEHLDITSYLENLLVLDVSNNLNLIHLFVNFNPENINLLVIDNIRLNKKFAFLCKEATEKNLKITHDIESKDFIDLGNLYSF